MKKLFMLLASVCFSASAFAQSTIVFNWGNTNPNVPACSSTVTSSCIVGQTITDMTVASSPVVLSSSISPAATTYTTPLPAFTSSNRTYTLVVNYKDASGKTQATGPATCGSGNTSAPCSVSVPLVVNPPTGFTATAQ